MEAKRNGNGIHKKLRRYGNETYIFLCCRSMLTRAGAEELVLSCSAVIKLVPGRPSCASRGCRPPLDCGICKKGHHTSSMPAMDCLHLTFGTDLTTWHNSHRYSACYHRVVLECQVDMCSRSLPLNWVFQFPSALWSKCYASDAGPPQIRQQRT
jgi:hypothetical protein